MPKYAKLVASSSVLMDRTAKKIFQRKTTCTAGNIKPNPHMKRITLNYTSFLLVTDTAELNFRYEYLSEFETILENALTSAAHMGKINETNLVTKIMKNIETRVISSRKSRSRSFKNTEIRRGQKRPARCY